MAPIALKISVTVIERFPLMEDKFGFRVIALFINSTSKSFCLSECHISIALEYPAIPPTLSTAIIASTPSISIIDRPTSPRAEEVGAITPCEGYLKDLQKTPNQRFQYLPKTSFFSGTHHRLCHAGESMTLLLKATLLFSPARGEVLNPLLFFNKNSIPFNTLFLLECVKITTVIFTHS